MPQKYLGNNRKSTMTGTSTGLPGFAKSLALPSPTILPPFTKATPDLPRSYLPEPAQRSHHSRLLYGIHDLRYLWF